MSDIQVSLYGSFAHTENWLKFFEQWRNNTVKYEIVIAGPNQPNFELPPEVTFIHMSPDPGPCHCAMAAARHTKGETMYLVGDDCIYSAGYLDKLYARYKQENDKKVMCIPRWCQAPDGTKGTGNHADLCVENDITDAFWELYTVPGRPDLRYGFPLWCREWFFELGGYDRRFGAGPFDADLMLRSYQRGGRYVYVMDAFISEPLGPESRAWNRWHGMEDVEQLMWQRWHDNGQYLGGKLLSEPRSPFEPIP